MDFYTPLKLLHVLSAMIWIGGAFVMLMFGMKAARARNDSELVGVIGQVGWAAERIFVPASLGTVALGVILATLGNMWSQLWVQIGLVGMVVTIALGVLALTPRAKKVAAAGAVNLETVAVSKQMVTLVKFDCATLFVVIADMVLKPQSGAWVTLAVMAIVVLFAAALWLVPVVARRPVPA
jgi:hypothetical protein